MGGAQRKQAWPHADCRGSRVHGDMGLHYTITHSKKLKKINLLLKKYPKLCYKCLPLERETRRLGNGEGRFTLYCFLFCTAWIWILHHGSILTIQEYKLILKKEKEPTQFKTQTSK